MRFNCGPTWAEKKAQLEDWHSWFAWRPVRVGSHDCRWLETIQRKGAHLRGLRSSWWSWEYREAGK
ncbi:hypothetical protein KAR91_73660 [Candidatus Pacearchaeota archaeon]|nr:hypothetical protein [Candidatus Pacearchaeota archaeon]